MFKTNFILFLLLLSIPVYGARNISLPHSEDFTESTSIDDIRWVSDTGGDLTRVQMSWRGGTNYCARLDPPTCDQCVNGLYVCLGAFHFDDTDILNISFAMQVGTTYNSTADPVSGGLINKFVDVYGNNGGTRRGILGLNERQACVGIGHQFGLLNMNTDVYHYYSSDACTTQVSFQDGEGGTNDLAGDWIWVNYILDNNTGDVKLYICDRDGNYSGLHHEIANGTDGSMDEIRSIGGYYNESHPTADTNSYILIDDLTISAELDSVVPPSGFLMSEEQAASQKKVDVVNVEEN